MLDQTKHVARHEQHYNLMIGDYLQEIATGCLHLKHGYASLLDYATGEWGYGPTAVMRRIDAM